MHMPFLNYFKLHGYHAIIGLLIITVGFMIARYSRYRIRTFLRKHSTDPTVKLFVVNVVYSVMLIVVIIMALNQFGVPTTSLITVLGAASLAVGLAIKDSLSNIASGLLVISLQPFRIGDTVDIEGVTGIVDQVNLFTTRIKTANNERIYLPNAKVMSSRINNKAYKGQRRLEVAIGISYDSDIRLARKIIEPLLDEDERVLADPEPSIVVSELADSAVILNTRVWVKKENYAKVKFDLLENIKLAFDEAGIKIPFPQREIHMHTKKDNN